MCLGLGEPPERLRVLRRERERETEPSNPTGGDERRRSLPGNTHVVISHLRTKTPQSTISTQKPVPSSYERLKDRAVRSTQCSA